MAAKYLKAARHFSGRDTYGRSVEYAMSACGKWFARHQKDDRYRGTSAWYEVDPPRFETSGVNAYTGERFTREHPVCMWGWNKMVELDGPHRLRLPVPEAA
jgi:hypothetical protein